MPTIAIILQGCPLGLLGPYGNEWVATPNLDRLAAEGVVFDFHYAEKPGDYPPWKVPPCTLIRHVRPGSPEVPQGFEVILAPPNPDDTSPIESLLRVLPNALNQLSKDPNGWLVIETDQLLPPWHAPQGVFDVYMEDLLEEGGVKDPESLSPWVDPPEGPMDTKDLALWEWLHRTAATAVTTFDAELGKVFDLLREKGFDTTATWVLTALAGYPLGEHGIIGYANPVPYEELAHIPLIVRYPNARHAGNRNGELTTPTDLATPLERWHELAGRETVFTETEAGQTLRTHDWTLLKEESKLFERPADRNEVNDLSNQQMELVEELTKQFTTKGGN